MTAERKADLEGRLAELEHEIWLAIRQGELKALHHWTLSIEGPNEPWFAVLTVGPVEDKRKT